MFGQYEMWSKEKGDSGLKNGTHDEVNTEHAAGRADMAPALPSGGNRASLARVWHTMRMAMADGDFPLVADRTHFLLRNSRRSRTASLMSTEPSRLRSPSSTCSGVSAIL